MTPEGPQSRFKVDLPENATVTDLLHALKINVSPEHVMILIDHHRVEPNHPLVDGDEVQVFPPISGGL